ncbi:hypothetical protein EDC32_1011335 [Laceyella sacchari]|jgi:hypothetical protein|uniref:hypothetical protein n=1 Tax=Laceyella sacchari TaxID=37482 RepID=UPI00104EE8D8|nr:hypothetical protein [Laceyella sacchari]TCW41668.1 hypothetical protein EDC32_1011335 [Laceyella sacchari]
MSIDISLQTFKRVEENALAALRKGMTPKDGLRRAHAAIMAEGLSQREVDFLFNWIVNCILTADARKLIMNEGHRPEIKEKFRRELGIAWQDIPIGQDLSINKQSLPRLKRYYLADEFPHSF